MQLMLAALALALANAGSSMAARMAMMAITTSSSINVKPFLSGWANRLTSRLAVTMQLNHNKFFRPDLTHLTYLTSIAAWPHGIRTRKKLAGVAALIGMEFENAPLPSSTPLALTVQFASGVNRLVALNNE